MVSKIAAIAILAAGCASTQPEQWTYQPDSQTQTRQAIARCKAYVDDQLWNAAYFGGMLVPIAALSSQKTMFNKCMKASGYVEENK